ncbi:MAG: hypothetical protein NZ108_11300, partial [Bacteroidia bacterium]|nr:hypothetical protein [Bacteroidia bacterium]
MKYRLLLAVFWLAGTISLLAQQNISTSSSHFGRLPTKAEVEAKMRVVDSLRNLPPLPPQAMAAMATAPESDCSGAIPICQQSYTQNQSYDDYGFVQELSGSTCLLAREQKTVWYVFTVQTSGTFGFTINTSYDYDFSLYDITTIGCQGIYNATPVRCNFSATYGNTGLNFPTAPGNLSYNASQPPFMPGVDVVAGTTYVLVLDNYTRDNTGYTITFTGTASIFDNTAPNIASVAHNCNTNQVTVNF